MIVMDESLMSNHISIDRLSVATTMNGDNGTVSDGKLRCTKIQKVSDMGTSTVAKTKYANSGSQNVR